MVKGSGNRILPVLAAVLVSIGLAVIIVLVFLREPEERRFDEYLRDAEYAIQSGNQREIRRSLLIASRYAVSSRNWHDLLSAAARGIGDDPEAGDYNLFSTVAGRAAASLPGDESLRAYWAWGLMRKGSIDKALDAADTLQTGKWDSLVAEITLKSVFGSDPEDLEKFISMINPGNDPEFLESAAYRSSSAELAFDAALLYMFSGRRAQAFNLINDVMAGGFRWNGESTAWRQGVGLASASIAQDFGDRDAAIQWLQERIDRNRERRALGWEELQMLGDLYWESFLLRGREEDREKASDNWREAMEIITASAEAGTVPVSSWRIWINQAVLEESRGRIRESHRLLDQALVLYPASHEVKASWALEMEDEEPAMARRLAKDAYEDSGNPVLGITAIRLDPESVSPRLYEARLWKLFEAATDPDSQIQESDSRIIAIFLLEYMSSRKNYSSVDVAVERFLKAHPDSDWILTWRLAADAARDMGMIDLVPAVPGGKSPYTRMREYALSEGSWRGLHDSAMYAVMTAGELREASNRLSVWSDGSGSGDGISEDTAVLAELEPLSERSYIREEPIGDRLRFLYLNRTDTEKERDRIASGRNRGDTARADMASVLEGMEKQLLEEALVSIEQAYLYAPELSGTDRASLLYLDALILNDLGRDEESRLKAGMAVDADPQHSRARQLLPTEN